MCKENLTQIVMLYKPITVPYSATGSVYVAGLLDSLLMFSSVWLSLLTDALSQIKLQLCLFQSSFSFCHVTIPLCIELRMYPLEEKYIWLKHRTLRKFSIESNLPEWYWCKSWILVIMTALVWTLTSFFHLQGWGNFFLLKNFVEVEWLMLCRQQRDYWTLYQEAAIIIIF